MFAIPKEYNVLSYLNSDDYRDIFSNNTIETLFELVILLRPLNGITFSNTRLETFLSRFLWIVYKFNHIYYKHWVYIYIHEARTRRAMHRNEGRDSSSSNCVEDLRWISFLEVLVRWTLQHHAFGTRIKFG